MASPPGAHPYSTIFILKGLVFGGLTFLNWSEGFPDSSVGKESACNAGDPRSIPGSGRSAEEGVGYPLQYSWASLVAQSLKNLPAMQRPGFDPWVGKIPQRTARQPNPVFLENPHGQRSLEGYIQSMGSQRVRNE